MSQKVRKGEELNEVNVKAFMLENKLINSVDSELNVSQFNNGFSNLTYALDIEDKSYVLRRPPFGAVKYGHDMGREFRVLSSLNQANFGKAPIAYAYTEDKAILGASFYIMEKVEGIILTLREAKKRAVTQKGFQQIANSWLDTYVELHQLDYKEIGLGDFGKPEGYVNRQVTNWSKQYLKAKTDEIPEATIVMKWLAENQPGSYNSCLIHNDFRYDNIVFADEKWNAVNAILDWEMCTIGDPLMDIGTTLSYWVTADDHPALQKGAMSPTILPGNPSRTEIVEMYAQKSGQAIDNLVFYYVYGLFKLAVIVQQIYYRYNKGLTNDPRFAELNKMAALLCKMGALSIHKNRIDKLM